MVGTATGGYGGERRVFGTWVGLICAIYGPIPAMIFVQEATRNAGYRWPRVRRASPVNRQTVHSSMGSAPSER